MKIGRVGMNLNNQENLNVLVTNKNTVNRDPAYSDDSLFRALLKDLSQRNERFIWKIKITADDSCFSEAQSN